MFGTILQFLSQYACCLYKIWSNNFVRFWSCDLEFLFCTALIRQYTGHLFNAFKFNGKGECLMVKKIILGPFGWTRSSPCYSLIYVTAYECNNFDYSFVQNSMKRTQ